MKSQCLSFNWFIIYLNMELLSHPNSTFANEFSKVAFPTTLATIGASLLTTSYGRNEFTLFSFICYLAPFGFFWLLDGKMLKQLNPFFSLQRSDKDIFTFRVHECQ